MMNHPTSDQREVEKAMEEQDMNGLRRLRHQARQLLVRLEQGRELSEQRAAEIGQRDPMKFVTGKSALDSAIAATRGMIGRMEALLAQFADEVEAIERDERVSVAPGTESSKANGFDQRGRAARAAACAGVLR